MLNLPNLLSLERVIAAPIVMALMGLQTATGNRLAAVLFVVSALTDLFDGMLARRMGLVSLLGKFLDPLADKILVLGTLIMLLELDRISPWLVLIIVGREITIGTLRTVAIGEGVVISARSLGKQKTALQMTGLLLLILAEPLPGVGLESAVIGRPLLWLGAALGLVSAVDYWRGFARARGAPESGTG